MVLADAALPLQRLFGRRLGVAGAGLIIDRLMDRRHQRMHAGKLIVTADALDEFLHQLAALGQRCVAQEEPKRAEAGMRAGDAVVVLRLDFAFGQDARYVLLAFQRDQIDVIAVLVVIFYFRRGTLDVQGPAEHFLC